MRNMKIFSLILLFFLIFSYIPQSAYAASDPPPDITAQHALLVEPESGTILFQKDPDGLANPASLTKIMTALLVIEEANFLETATVSQHALDILDPDSSTANLKAGEEILVEYLLDCILIASANDACNVVAEHMYGNIDAFVDRMNQRAKELGCKNTHFMNTHGLTDPEHYTTANDVYLITLEAMKHSKFMEVCNTASVIIPSTNMSDERTFYTTNNLISRLKTPDYIYHYAKGIKTGHTSAAGYCLVSSAEKDNMLLVCIVLGSIKDPDTGKTMSFVDSKNLYEWGFSEYSYQTMLNANSPVAEMAVTLSSEADYVSLKPAHDVQKLLPTDFNMEDVKLNVTLYHPEGVSAPVIRGDNYGTVTVIWNGVEYDKVDLVALNSVALDKVLLYAKEMKDFFSQAWIKYVIGGIILLIVAYIVFVIILNVRRRKQRNRRIPYRGNRKYR